MLLAVILYAKTLTEGRPTAWALQDASGYAVWALLALILYPLVGATPLTLKSWAKRLPVLLLIWHLGSAFAHTTEQIVHQGLVHDEARQRSVGEVISREIPRQLTRPQFRHFADFCGLLAVCIILVQIRSSRAREIEHSKLTSQLADARLNALRAQMQPHFLFNTLNTVATLVTTDSKAAIEVLAHLSDLLRNAATTDEGHFTTIKEEFELTRKYITIMQHRFGDRVRVSIECDASIEPALIPLLSLQPLVENAYKHGVGPRSTGGTIEVKGNISGDHIQISVCDDGLGQEANANENGQGMALKNIQDRMDHLYEKQGSLTFRYREEGGFCAIISVPFMLTETI